MKDDTISRAAAIDALDEQIRQCDKALSAFDISMKDEYAVKVERASLVAFRETLEYMPSAQPEIKTDGDTISRQAAIENSFEVYTKEYGWCEVVGVDAISELPSAQPEQQWIPWTSGRFPEESGTYTVTAYDGATNRVTYAKYQKRLKRWELTGSRAYWRVLAWCLPPEPYREEEQDG